MTHETILVDIADGVATVTLNRPRALNALNRQLLTELHAAITELGRSGSIRATILTGSGEKAFAAGADITEMKGLTAVQMAEFAQLGHALGLALESAPFPTIAAVNGLALGGGCELAMACDFIHAAEEAKFGQPEVNLGLIPGFGGSTRLVRRVGVAWARELCFTGDPLPASEALRIGLCNRVFPRASLMEEARKTALKIASRGPLAVRQARHVILATQDMDQARANMFEAQAFGLTASSADAQEGMAAFTEKRAAAFKGA